MATPEPTPPSPCEFVVIKVANLFRSSSRTLDPRIVDMLNMPDFVTRSLRFVDDVIETGVDNVETDMDIEDFLRLAHRAASNFRKAKKGFTQVNVKGRYFYERAIDVFDSIRRHFSKNTGDWRDSFRRAMEQLASIEDELSRAVGWVTEAHTDFNSLSGQQTAPLQDKVRAVWTKAEQGGLTAATLAKARASVDGYKSLLADYRVKLQDCSDAIGDMCGQLTSTQRTDLSRAVDVAEKSLRPTVELYESYITSLNRPLVEADGPLLLGLD